MTITLCGRLILKCCDEKCKKKEANRDAWSCVIATIELIGYIASVALACKELFDGSYPTKLCMTMLITPMALMGVPAIGIGILLTFKTVTIQKVNK